MKPTRWLLLLTILPPVVSPPGTARGGDEELMQELKNKYTIAIVTHNLQQAKRIADMTAFLYVDTSEGGRTGEQHTKEYIRGEFS